MLTIKQIIKKCSKNSMIVKLIAGLIFIAVIKCCIDIYIYSNKPKPFEEFSNPKELIYFYMDGCGHCKTFTPTWDEFTNSYKGNLKLNKYERKQAGDMIDKFQIQGFPTILLIDEQGNKKEFNGDRTVKGLEQFVNN
tara:strand:- start:116 stop:526 length:411 start_codon:yes stop_codon:yes gene_type:complete